MSTIEHVPIIARCKCRGGYCVGCKVPCKHCCNISVSQRGKRIIWAYEDYNAMINGIKFETKNILRK